MVNIPIKVEIGKKIHEWTVIKFDENPPRKGRHYICECKCGRQMSKPISDLIKIGPKQCKSCACKERNFGSLGHTIIDMVGKKIGKWTVIDRVSIDKTGAYWRCQCECGDVYHIFGGELRRGKSKQCKTCATLKHGACIRKNRKSEYNSYRRGGNPDL